MLIYSLKRLALALLVALTVSLISFSLLFASGDPAIALAGETASDADIDAIRKLYGFDQPIYQQYFSWVGSALTGDLGESFYFKEPVSHLIFSRMPTTMALGASAILFAIVFSIPLGMLAAIRPNTWIDRLCLFLSVLGQAMPSFWFALTLVVIFAVNLQWLPVSGSDTWVHFILPTVVLGYYAAPAIMRLTRAGMMDVLEADYIRTARAKGLRESKVLFKHALRNALVPVVSLAAVQFGFMLGGSVVVESVFSISGAGYLAYESIGRNDFPTVQGLILVFTLIYITLTFLSDLFNAWLNPRIRGN